MFVNLFRNSPKAIIDIMTKIENWEKVVGYENLYLISDLGNLKSVKNDLIFTYKRTCKDGYKFFRLSKNGVKKDFFIHRLVADAFLPNKENKRTVNHINLDKTDNRLINLEWATDKEQAEHYWGINRIKITNKNMNYEKEVLNYLSNVENATLEDIYKNISASYYHNWSKYTGMIMSRLIKANKVERVKRGIFKTKVNSQNLSLF